MTTGADDPAAVEETEQVDEVPVAAASGVPAVDAAAERLNELDDAPLEDHVAIYDDVHRRLQEGLADLDEQ